MTKYKIVEIVRETMAVQVVLVALSPIIITRKTLRKTPRLSDRTKKQSGAWSLLTLCKTLDVMPHVTAVKTLVKTIWTHWPVSATTPLGAPSYRSSRWENVIAGMARTTETIIAKSSESVMQRWRSPTLPVLNVRDITILNFRVTLPVKLRIRNTR